MLSRNTAVRSLLCGKLLDASSMLLRLLDLFHRIMSSINDNLRRVLWLIIHLMLIISGYLNRRPNYSLFISEINTAIATQLLLTELFKRIIAQLPYLVSI